MQVSRIPIFCGNNFPYAFSESGRPTKSSLLDFSSGHTLKQIDGIRGLFVNTFPNSLLEFNSAIGPAREFFRYGRLGSGGTANVYLAGNGLGEYCALKRYGTAREVLVKNELEAASSLKHSSLVLPASSIEHNGGIFLEGDLINGITFKDGIRMIRFLNSGEVSELAGIQIDKALYLRSLDQDQREALKLEVQVYLLGLIPKLAEGILEIENKGKVHRDVKPSNLMLDIGSIDIAKLIDFGLCVDHYGESRIDRSIEQIISHLNGSTPNGTLDFISPEQLAGGIVDTGIDIRALAVVIHQILTGELPFTKTRWITTVRNILEGNRKEVVFPEFSHRHDLADLVDIQLSTSRDSRFSNIEFVQALKVGVASLLSEKREELTFADNGAVSPSDTEVNLPIPNDQRLTVLDDSTAAGGIAASEKAEVQVVAA